MCIFHLHHKIEQYNFETLYTTVHSCNVIIAHDTPFWNGKPLPSLARSETLKIRLLCLQTGNERLRWWRRQRRRRLAGRWRQAATCTSRRGAHRGVNDRRSRGFSVTSRPFSIIRRTVPIDRAMIPSALQDIPSGFLCRPEVTGFFFL